MAAAEEFRDKCRSSDERCDSLIKEMKSLKEALRAADENRKQEEAKTNRVTAEMEKWREEIGDLRLTLAANQIELQRLEQEKSKMRSDLLEQRDKFEQEKQQLDSRISQLCGINDQLRSDAVAKDELLQSFKTDKDNLRVDVTAWKERHHSLQNRIQQLESDQVACTQEMERLQHKNVDLQAQVSRVKQIFDSFVSVRLSDASVIGSWRKPKPQRTERSSV